MLAENITLDVDRIGPKLYIGSAPPTGPTVASMGFDVVVLAAREYQPRSHDLPGVTVVHAGIRDTLEPADAEIQMALEASRIAARSVMRGERVLVSCWMGRNRSGLVAAFTLIKLYGLSGGEAIDAVRRARHGALFNPAFEKLVKELA